MSHNQGSRHNDDDDTVPMESCPHCDVSVPSSNLALHMARCQSRKPAARPSHDSGPLQPPTNNSTAASPDIVLPRASWETAASRRNQYRGGGGRHTATVDENTALNMSIDEQEEGSDDDDEVIVVEGNHPSAQDIIDLVDDDEEDEDLEEDKEDHWACPRCTLHNPRTASTCAACNYTRPESERPPDPVRRERLIHDGSGGGNHNGPLSPSDGQLMAGSILMGGILGGANAYARGNELSSGILHGSLTGAVAGTLFSDIARQAATTTQSTSANPHVRSTYRSIRAVQSPDGRVQVTTSTSAPSNRSSRSSRHASAGYSRGTTQSEWEADLFLRQMLLQQQMMGLGRRYRAGQPQLPNIDGMSYEQMLHMFGDGSENMGAQEGEIRSLPSSVVQDPDKLPADGKQCSVCLEDFAQGDERKILPCLHGFHSSCVDKWLRTNKTCPICKHRIN